MRGSGALWRAIEAARRGTLIASGAAAPVPAQPSATRRALLKGLIAAAAAPALPQPARATGSGRVAIIGGGIAGLTALHHLRAAGVDAELYEARARLGGRMLTLRSAAGPAFEAGGQLVNSDHDDLRSLAETFDVPLVDRKQEPHRTLILADGRPVPDALLADRFAPLATQIGRDADRLDADPARVGAELDALSMADYLDRHAALLPEAWMRTLIEHSARSEYGVEPDRASAIELVFNLPTVDGTRFEVLGGADERFVLGGGSSALIAAMARGHAGRIHLGRQLLRVDRRRGGYRLAFLDGSRVDAEQVIVAVPAPVTRQIAFGGPMPLIWRQWIEAMEIGRNEKVQARASAAVWQATIGFGGELWQTDPQAGFALGWDGSVLDEHAAAERMWTWFLGGEQATQAGPADALARGFARASEGGVPGLLAATGAGPFRRTGWHRDPLSLGAYVNYAPGHLTRFGRLLWIESDDPAERQQARAGGILFAGEHLSDAFPGYMNGAAQTGRLAAEAIVGRGLAAQAA